jgi:hypothetical protein
MGVQREVTFASGEPAWAAVAAKLAEAGERPTVRMIDGQPAFPDEQPEDGWRELRLGFAAGMVTIAREGGRWRFTIWGADDPPLAAVLELCVSAATFALAEQPERGWQG